jgi:hypothetical protein
MKHLIVRWLRFLGWLDEAEREHHPYHAKVAIFEKWLRQERGLSTATVQDYCRAIDHFFFWLAGKGTPLDAVQLADMDDAVAEVHRRGAWSRRTIHDYAQRLRPFFLFAEARGWCRAGLAAGIMAPRFMADETVPKGIKRDDVLRLLALFRGIVQPKSATAQSLCCLSLTGCVPEKSRAFDSTIWTGRTKSFAFAARSQDGPMSGRFHWTSAMPFCATYAKLVRPVMVAVSSSLRMRRSDHSAESPSARSFMIVSPE